MAEINLIGEINEAMLEKVLRAPSFEDLHINLCSEGGSATVGRAIYGILRARQGTTSIYVYGSCYSAATLILAAAQHRLSAPSTIFMFHDSTHKLKGDLNTLIKDVKDVAFDEKLWCELLTERTQLSVKQLRALHRKTTYFTAKQALEFGLITGLLEG